MYSKVPARVTALSSRMLMASPKSQILRRMSLVNKMFSGLMSLRAGNGSGTTLKAKRF
jgi:hypothetical protein